MKSPTLCFSTLFFIILTFFTSPIIFAQNAYQDAVELSKYLNEDGTGFQTQSVAVVEEWTSILAKYIDPIEDLTAENVIDLIVDTDGDFENPNPFLEPLMPEGQLESAVSGAALRVKRQKKGILSQIGGLKVNRFADGLAQFLIQRSQEELYVSYFKKLQETFKEYPEFENLMPQVHDFVALFQSYQYKEMIPVVREGFKKDLESLPNHLITLKHLTPSDCPFDDEQCRKRMKEYQDFFATDGSKFFIASNIILNQLIEGANPVEMLEALNEHEDFKDLEEFRGLAKNFVNGMKMLEFFSDNLRYVGEQEEAYELQGEETAEERQRLWIDKEDWRKLSRPSFRIFMGLLYQQEAANDIYFMINGEEKPLRNILGKFAENLNPMEEYLTTFVKRTNALDRHLQDIETKRKANEDFSYRDYYTYYNATLDFLKHFFEIDNFIGNYVEGLNSSEKADHFLDLADLTGEIYYDLHTRHFSTAVLNTIVLLDKSIAKESFEASKFRKQFLKYGSFMAALAEAEDAETAKVVLEATVMPVGSARIKRDTKSNVALNAYLGGFLGSEYLTDLSEWKGIVGIYAPVGVSFSWGVREKLTKQVEEGILSPHKKDSLERLSKKKKNYRSKGSWSLFLSMIDIGAVTAFRMDDDSTEALPELRLQNILAPGLQIVKGCANSPLSFGIGIQAGPMLRTIRGEEGLEPKAIFNDKLNYRIQAFLAVDIPLINFKTETW